MRAVIQRVSSASVEPAGGNPSAIGAGAVILLGVERDDGPEDVEWLGAKTARMRIFSDETGLMNRSLLDTGGEALVVSQFTLHAATKKGNRPSFIRAAEPEKAIQLYEAFVTTMRRFLGEERVGTGEFGASMQLTLTNDGPVTIIIDSRIRE